jgi:hypothetical protein
MDGPTRDLLHPNFWDEYGPHRSLLGKIEQAEISPDPPRSDEEVAKSMEELKEVFGETVPGFTVIRFHAWREDSPYCGQGIRCIEDADKADALVRLLRNEPDHACGPDSVTTEISINKKIPDEGLLPPYVRDKWHPTQS